MSDQKIYSIVTSNYSIKPELSCYGTKARVKFSGSCLKQYKAKYNHGTIVNIYIVYEISKYNRISRYPTLENCLFGTVSLTKHADMYQYNILDMVLDFIEKDSFHLVMDLVEMQ